MIIEQYAEGNRMNKKQKKKKQKKKKNKKKLTDAMTNSLQKLFSKNHKKMAVVGRLLLSRDCIFTCNKTVFLGH